VSYQTHLGCPVVSTRNLMPYEFRKLMCFYFIIYRSPIPGDSIIKPVDILKKTNIAILNVSCLYILHV